jgi:16S rRNA processing protein RimM
VAEPTDRLELLDPGRRVTVAGHEAKVEWRKGTPQRPLVKLEGADGRTRAEELRGEAILVSRAELAPLAEGEFLVDDLIGCVVVDGAAGVGEVRDVLVLPAADVLEVERARGARVLIPLVGDAVRSVDVPGRRIDVDMGFVNADGD